MSIKSLKIGNVLLENNIALAPMAGVTDIPFRLICKEFGVGYMVSEMVSTKALFYKDKKTPLLIKTLKEEEPIAIQIFGSDPIIMAYGAKVVEEMGAKIIDINMGCPAPKIVSSGDGSALMKSPLLAGKIVESVKKAVSVPVTVKFRSGFDENNINALEFAKIIENSGADGVTVHGRTRNQFYSGKSDSNIIRLVKECVSIPVFGNGDIFSPIDAKNMFDFTHCDGIMIGRGCEGNPFLIKDIIDYLKDGILNSKPTPYEKIVTAKRHFNLLIKYKGEHLGVLEGRKHMGWYLKGCKKAAYFKNEINKLISPKDVIKTLDLALEAQEYEL